MTFPIDVAGGSLDHYANLVRRFLGVPVALVTLVERDRQVFPGLVGLGEPWRSSRETPLSHSFCSVVVADEKPLVLSDARLDLRLCDNLAIRDLGVVAYAGWPLLDRDGRAVGSLCAIDTQPRSWTDDEVDSLEDLAQACSAQLQSMLRQAEDHESLTRTVFEAVDVGLAIYDTDDTLLLANAAARKHAGATGARIEQPPVVSHEASGTSDRPGQPVERRAAHRGPDTVTGRSELEWTGPPGKRIAVVTSTSPVLRADGTPWGTLYATHDLTGLARAIEVREQFIAAVSHELRTPLTAILLYQEALAVELRPGPGFVADALGAVRRSALRLQERIGELLATADGCADLRPRPTDLCEVARLVASTVGEQAKAYGVTLTVEAQQPQWALADARRLEQAVENIVSNAMKYTPRGGHVAISTEAHAETVRLVVTDDGVGMTPDEVARARETFWRAETARRAAVQGMGIGLTLVDAIVTQHGGRLCIESRPGQGTTVVVEVPRCPAPEDQPEPW